MSCNCNTSSKTCNPCSICTPPGVTGLTSCKPIDPCEGTKLDISCIQYSGIDYSCVGVYNGDKLIDVLLKILALYISQSKCCELAGTGVVTRCGLAGTINYYIAPTTTTTSTSTTTTTTLAPSCSYKQMTNVATQPSVVSYVPCNSTIRTQITIITNALVCSNNAYSVDVISGAVSEQILSTCNTPPPPTTTSTTTTAPCTCNIYTVTNLSFSPITITFTECGSPNFQTSLSIRANETVEVCACADILDNIIDRPALIISPAGTPCTNAVNSLEVCIGDGCTGSCSCEITTTVYYNGIFAPGVVLYSDAGLTTYYYNAVRPNITYGGMCYLVSSLGSPMTLVHHC